MARRRKEPKTGKADRDVVSAEPAPDLPALYRRVVEANRYLPVPKEEQSFVGDGDFRAIGAEFLELFIRYGGLRPDCDVLDLGCGIGRMAVPLTQYLSPAASYTGVDVNRHGLTWCRRHISRIYPNFGFHHVDYHNELYNPSGKKLLWESPLPFAPASFDFIIATSVFTHLSRQELKAYFRQLATVLRPGGRLFATFFLIDDVAVEAMGRPGARLAFPVRDGVNLVNAAGLPGGSAVAVRSDYLDALLIGNALSHCQPPLRGTWSGAVGGVTYQDVVVAEKPAAPGEA